MFNWYKYELESPSFIDEAMKAKAYLLKARDAVEEAKYIEKLIFSDYVRIIRAAPSSWDYCTDYIKKAKEQLSETKKKKREDLSFIEHKIKESFFNELDFDIEINDIIAGGIKPKLKDGKYYDSHRSIVLYSQRYKKNKDESHNGIRPDLKILTIIRKK